MSDIRIKSSSVFNNYEHDDAFCECESVSDKSKIKCGENNSIFYLINSNKELIEKITVDGCVYPRGGHELRCDYALNYHQEQDAKQSLTIFVELKGKDFKHALKQILATANDAKFTINSKKYAVVVKSRFPSFDPGVEKLKSDLRREKQIELIHHNRVVEKSLEYFKNPKKVKK